MLHIAVAVAGAVVVNLVLERRSRRQRRREKGSVQRLLHAAAVTGFHVGVMVAWRGHRPQVKG